MSCAKPPAGRRCRDVFGLLDEQPPIALELELVLALGKSPGDPPASHPDPLARLGLGGGGQGADLTVGQGQRAHISLVCQTGALECLEGVSSGKGGQCLGDGCFEGNRVERADLDWVIALVGSRHRFQSFRLSGRTGDGSGQLRARERATSRTVSLEARDAGPATCPTGQLRPSGAPAGNVNRNSAPPDAAWPTATFPS